MKRLLIVTMLLLDAGSGRADVSTVMFQNDMVLQQGMVVPVFGTAAPGEQVTVAFRGQSRSTQADSDGHWRVTLAAMKAGGPFEMTIQGKNTLSLSNVMVGEVWLCSGQSNMSYSMKRIGGRNLEEAARANAPNIRILTMKYNQHSHWQVMTPAVCLKSSATAYYFGKDLQAKRNVPVGLIVSASPGTAIRYWLDPAAIKADGKLVGTKSVGKWYNEFVKPVIPYAIRGAIWYQGESDVGGNVQDYRSRFFNLIKNYRQHWGEGDFPFLYVQIASYGDKQKEPGVKSDFAALRDVQTQALSLPNTAMAVTIDIGAKDWHPENKWDVGKRLVLPALRLVYGDKDVAAYSGPMLASCHQKDGKIYLRFNHVDGGLVDKDHGDLKGFAVCGSDHQWHWAQGTIVGTQVVLSCDAVKDPIEVRYAWADAPIATPLYNAAGLPAVPFQVSLPETTSGNDGH